MRLIRKDIGVFSLFIIVYLAIISAQKTIGFSTQNIFPFFAWDLFTRVPQMSTDYAILAEEIDQKKLASPIDLKHLWRPTLRHSPSNYFPAPTDLALALKENRPQDARKILLYMQSKFFPQAKNIKFVLYQVTFDPLEVWKDESKKTWIKIQDLPFEPQTQRPTGNEGVMPGESDR